MSTVRVYRWDDDGAPAHPNNVRGSMAALMRACLVTGYGVMPAAGWTEPFPETDNYACFRSTVIGSQFYQIDDNHTTDAVAKIVMCDSMSDASTVTGSNTLVANYYFGKWHSVTHAAKNEWFVIADAKTCYIFLSSINGFCPHGIGNLFHYGEEALEKDFVAGHSTAGWMVDDMRAALGDGANLFYVASAHSGTAQAVWVDTGGNVAKTGGNALNGTQYYPAPTAGVNVAVAPAIVIPNVSTDRRPIGHLRGYYFPLAYKPRANKETFTLGDRTFIALDIGGDVTLTTRLGQVYIDITGSWEEST